jgi:hypothetical protein
MYGFIFLVVELFVCSDNDISIALSLIIQAGSRGQNFQVFAFLDEASKPRVKQAAGLPSKYCARR